MPKTRKCAYCGKVFTTNSGMQKYCSEECATAAKETKKKRQRDFLRSVEPVMELQQQEYLTFSKAAITESNYPKVRALFEAQGIKVDDQQFTCRGSMGPVQAGHPNQQDLENLRSFVKKTV